MEKDGIWELISSQKVIDTHEHLSLQSKICEEGANLLAILPRSYVGDFDFYPGLNAEYLQFQRGTSLENNEYPSITAFIREFNDHEFLESINSGIESIYDIPIKKMSESSFHALNEGINRNYHDACYYDTILDEHMNVEKAILDIPHSGLGLDNQKFEGFNSKKFYTSIRINSLLFGFDTDAWTPSTSLMRRMQEDFKVIVELPTDMNDFLEKTSKILEWTGDKVVSYKCASAYERGLNFGPRKESLEGSKKYEISKKIYGKKFEKVSLDERNAFGDVIFHHILDIIEKQGKTIQIHTGMAIMEGSNPKNLENVFSSYPDLNFTLLHCGYPWIDETIEILKNHENVHAEMVWLQMLSKNAARKFLDCVLDLNLEDKVIAFGGDCACIEGSLGALNILKQVLHDVFSSRIEKGKNKANDVETILDRLLYENANSLFFKK
ncbi:MAG: amidohydrolase family protein [Candidatus Hodarchaeota archaeon]